MKVTDQSPTSIAKVKNGGAVMLLPYMFSLMVLDLLNVRKALIDGVYP
jgi:hypothetical protein